MISYVDLDYQHNFVWNAIWVQKFRFCQISCKFPPNLYKMVLVYGINAIFVFSASITLCTPHTEFQRKKNWSFWARWSGIVSSFIKLSKNCSRYNAETRTCESFLYTGCQGNNNRFHTLNECQSYCKNINGEPFPIRYIHFSSNIFFYFQPNLNAPKVAPMSSIRVNFYNVVKAPEDMHALQITSVILTAMYMDAALAKVCLWL